MARRSRYELTLYFSFFAAAALLAIVPGPGILFVLAQTSKGGKTPIKTLRALYLFFLGWKALREKQGISAGYFALGFLPTYARLELSPPVFFGPQL